MKYHISPKTGRPNICRAVYECPLKTQEGKPAPHFDNKETARAYYEKENSHKEFEVLSKKPKKPVVKYEVDTPYGYETEVEEIEAVMEDCRRNKRKMTGLEMSKRQRIVEELMDHVGHSYSTHILYTSYNDRGELVYNPERVKVHKRIVAELLKKYQNVPNGGEVMISGGLAGGGKTTVLKNFANLDLSNYAMVNPDDVKEILAEEDMVPKMRGVTPMEASQLIHEESLHVTRLFTQELVKEKKNILLDTTMADEWSFNKKVAGLKEGGYEKFDAIFVDIDIDTSIRRSKERYQRGMDDYCEGHNHIGGRVLPEWVVQIQESPSVKYSSLNAMTLVELYRSGYFTGKPRVFDNRVDGRDPEEIDFEGFLS